MRSNHADEIANSGDTEQSDLCLHYLLIPICRNIQNFTIITKHMCNTGLPVRVTVG